MARPRLSDDERRSLQLTLWVNPVERRAIEERASAAGQSIPAYIRQRAVRDHLPITQPRRLGAAENAGSYYRSLPEKYRRQWNKSGIGDRIKAVSQQAETSLRGRLSGDRQQYVADAVRRQCGAQAQRFDRAMRIDQAYHRPKWDVRQRRETLKYERQKNDRPSVAGTSLQRTLTVARSIGKVVADQEQEQAPQGGGGPQHDRDMELFEL